MGYNQAYYPLAKYPAPLSTSPPSPRARHAPPRTPLHEPLPPSPKHGQEPPAPSEHGATYSALCPPLPPPSPLSPPPPAGHLPGGVPAGLSGADAQGHGQRSGCAGIPRPPTKSGPGWTDFREVWTCGAEAYVLCIPARCRMMILSVKLFAVPFPRASGYHLGRSGNKSADGSLNS